MRLERELTFSAQELRDAARAMSGLGEHAQAAQLYQRALEVAPDDLGVAMRLAYHFVEAGLSRSAASVYAGVAVTEATNGSKGRSMVLARRAYDCDRDRCTASRLEPWARLVGSAASALLCEAAEHHRGHGNADLARDLLRLAVDLDPTRAAACKRLVDLELVLGDREAARARLDAMGRVLLAQGRMAEFETVAEQLLAFDPSHAFFLRKLVDAYLRTGRAREAVPRLHALLRAEPDDPSPLVTLAQVHAGLRQREASLAALARWVWVRYRRGGESVRPEIERVLDRAEHWWPGDERFVQGLIDLSLFGPESEQAVRMPPPPPQLRVA